MGFVEKILDALFEYRLIRDGCEAESTANPVYMKRWFLVKNQSQLSEEDASIHMPAFNLTVSKKDGRQIFLHKFLRSDADRELHDHPWDFTALIVWRGYYEETENSVAAFNRKTGQYEWIPSCEADMRRPDVLKPSIYDGGLTKVDRKWPGMVLRRKAEHRHRVQLVDGKPSWSLFFTTTKKRNWGFWRDGAMIPWRKFIAKKCEDRPT